MINTPRSGETASSHLGTFLAVMWSVIAVAALVRLLSGSEWWGTIALLVAGVAAAAAARVHFWWRHER